MWNGLARVGPGRVAVVSGLDVAIPNFLWNRQARVAEFTELAHGGGFFG